MGASKISLAPPLILDDEAVEFGVDELEAATLDGTLLDWAELDSAALEIRALLDELRGIALLLFDAEVDDVLLAGLYSIGKSGFPWSEFFCVSSQL